jgi:hypothetical protein
MALNVPEWTSAYHPQMPFPRAVFTSVGKAGAGAIHIANPSHIPHVEGRGESVESWYTANTQVSMLPVRGLLLRTFVK